MRRVLKRYRATPSRCCSSGTRAGCLDNQENAVNRQIDAALDDEDQAEGDD
jgi:hypothetical protein